MPAVIVLATYNGSLFLREQLESIVNQAVDDWHLLISDDGSSDGTLEILENFCRRERRAELLPPRMPASGAAGNFEYLLKRVHETYPSNTLVCLCDQDDIWSRDKLGAHESVRAQASGSFSDLSLIDEGGAEISPSFFQLVAAPERPSVKSLLCQNFIPGCAFALNSEVLKLALPFPEGVVNHDWWLALCCMCLGGLRPVEKKLVKYRQHKNNVVGGRASLRRAMKTPVLINRQKAVLCGQIHAASVLTERLGDLTPEQLATLRTYAGLGAMSVFSRSHALSFGEFGPRTLSMKVLRGLAAAII